MAVSASLSGRLIRAPQVLTTGTTYTRPAGCSTIVVELVGGGAGGGGVTGSAANAAMAGGGGSGGFARKTYSNVPATCTYAIGAGGAGGTTAPTAGSAGGDTTFTDGTTLVTAKGGSGGASSAFGTAFLPVAGGAGGVVSTNGDVNTAGTPGEQGLTLSGTTGISGPGGSTPFGRGGKGFRSTNSAGDPAIAYGAGGGGAASTSTAQAGGAGSAGVILVWEYA